MKRIYIIEYKFYSPKNGTPSKYLKGIDNIDDYIKNKREFFDYRERQEFIDRYLELKQDVHDMYDDIHCYVVDYDAFEIKDMQKVIYNI